MGVCAPQGFQCDGAIDSLASEGENTGYALYGASKFHDITGGICLDRFIWGREDRQDSMRGSFEI